MSNYFDNQTNWSWHVTNDRATMTTEHTHPKPHTHTIDVTNVPIGEMMDNPGKVMGEAHRAVPHDYKDSQRFASENNKKAKEISKVEKRNDFIESLKVDSETMAKLAEVSKNNNTQKSSKTNNGGRERGDDGPGRQGRESGFKSGKNVSTMRADMKTNSNISAKQSKQNGHTMNTSSKTTSASAVGHNSAGKTGNSSPSGGHSSPSGSTGISGGHVGTGGRGGHGGTGGRGGHGGTGGRGGH